MRFKVLLTAAVEGGAPPGVGNPEWLRMPRDAEDPDPEPDVYKLAKHVAYVSQSKPAFSPVLLDNAEPPIDVLRGMREGVEATNEWFPKAEDGLPLIVRTPLPVRTDMFHYD